MNAPPAGRKKAGNIALAVLGTVALYMVYSTFFSGPDAPPQDSAQRSTPGASPAAVPTAVEEQSGPKRAPARARSEEFHPVLHSKRPEDRIDPTKVDPTLRLDLLAKVMGVAQAGGSRNLFAFSTPPPKAEEAAALKGPEPRIMGPFPVPPPAPPQPKVEPPLPPINIQFYGYSMVRDSGKKLAYFLDGDCKPGSDLSACEIVIASEGDTLKKSYKLVRISPSSVVVEEIKSKRQQNLPITAEAQSQ